jgi:hypothetical protein
MPRLTPKRCNSEPTLSEAPISKAVRSYPIEIDVARFTRRFCPDSWHDPFRRSRR